MLRPLSFTHAPPHPPFFTEKWLKMMIIILASLVKSCPFYGIPSAKYTPLYLILDHIPTLKLTFPRYALISPAAVIR